MIRPDQTAERREVTVGHEDLQVSVIATGLQAGEQVVVDGAARLSDNSKVTLASPAGSPPATPAATPPGRRRPATP